EKSAPYYASRIHKKLLTYLNETYKDEINTFSIDDTKYKNTKYTLKVKSKENKNLYFIVTYNSKKITDTYKEDYLEGKTLINTLEQNLEKELKESYHQDFNITFLKSLDKYSNQVKKHIISKNSFKDLKVYTLETTINSKWNTSAIGKSLIDLNTKLKDKNITPKNYQIILTNTNDLTKSVKVNNLTSEQIENITLLNDIIGAIIKNENSNILKENNITYKYLN
ncbi:MAG: hypothetical protein ACI4WP_03205, partial [Bacilli bacterium]